MAQASLKTTAGCFAASANSQVTPINTCAVAVAGALSRSTVSTGFPRQSGPTLMSATRKNRAVTHPFDNASAVFASVRKVFSQSLTHFIIHPVRRLPAPFVPRSLDPESNQVGGDHGCLEMYPVFVNQP